MSEKSFQATFHFVFLVTFSFLFQQVNHLHMKMVMWICNILLRLCPDHPSTMQEAKEALYATCPTPEELLEEITSMFPQVKEMSEKISR